MAGILSTSGCFSTHLLDELTIKRVNKDTRRIHSIEGISVTGDDATPLAVVVRARLEDGELWDFRGGLSEGASNGVAVGQLSAPSAPFVVFTGTPLREVKVGGLVDAAYGGPWRTGSDHTTRDAANAVVAFKVAQGDGSYELVVFSPPKGGRVVRNQVICLDGASIRVSLVPNRSPPDVCDGVADVARVLAYFSLILPLCAFDLVTAPIQIPLALLDVGGLGRWTIQQW